METNNSEGGNFDAQPSACVLSSILSTEECAALLRCSTDRVEQLVAEGILPGYKFGRGWVFHREMLIAAVGELCSAAYQKRKSRSGSAGKTSLSVDPDARAAGTEPRPSSLPVIEPKTKRPRGGARRKMRNKV
jgi:excisionase family DNA binding protein